MKIRDPVHGDLTFPPFVKRLLDTKALQRLRGIRQLGFAYLVYPGCLHTRFDHSLGASHVAQRLYKACSPNFSTEEHNALIAAALLHDVAHIPFGHTLEDEFKLFPRHDAVERFSPYLESREIAAVLRSEGLSSLVSDILRKELPSGRNYLAEIISGTVDADVLDYLRRDVYFAGLVQSYDDRVLSNFSVDEGSLVYKLVNKGLERADAKSELIHLLRLRYYLTERLYYHHTKIAAGVMLTKLLEQLEVQLCHLRNMGDDVLLHYLQSEAERLGDGRAINLASGLMARSLYKRCFVAGSNALFREKWAQRHNLEREIAELAGVSPSQVGVYLGPLDSFKEASILVRSRRGIEPLGMLEEDEIKFLKRQYQRLTRFYVFAPEDCVPRVRIAAENIFGAENNEIQTNKAH